MPFGFLFQKKKKTNDNMQKNWKTTEKPVLISYKGLLTFFYTVNQN